MYLGDCLPNFSQVSRVLHTWERCKSRSPANRAMRHLSVASSVPCDMKFGLARGRSAIDSWAASRISCLKDVVDLLGHITHITAPCPAKGVWGCRYQELEILAKSQRRLFSVGINSRSTDRLVFLTSPHAPLTMHRFSSLHFLLIVIPAMVQSEVPLDSPKMISNENALSWSEQFNLKVSFTSTNEEKVKKASVSWKNPFTDTSYVLVWHFNEDTFNFHHGFAMNVSSQPSQQHIRTEIELQPNRIYWLQILHPECNVLGTAAESFPCTAVEVVTFPGGLNRFIILCITVVVISLVVSGSYLIYSVHNGSVKFAWNEEAQTSNEDTGTRIFLLTLDETVQRLLSNGEEPLALEFESLKEQSPNKTVKVASLTSNKYKNRYANILPFDRTRVILEQFSDDPYSDYINASYVHSFTKNERFIATQGPKKSTLQDFWRMIWEKNVYVIIMVTSCNEGTKNKCSKYWPHVKEEPFCFPREGLTVDTTKESTKDGYIVRRIQIMKGDDQRSCLQYQYLEWPDMGCPASPSALVSFVAAVRPIFNLGDFHVVVHCSAGVGRTGTFIGLHNIMQEIDKGISVDIYECVLRMRNCRMNMVQTQRQYAYLYKCALQYYKQTTAARKGSSYLDEV
ncbi:receptor-type tyrosine-protein phosphatase C-like [Penaeus chinensis]|uniref:receptor-type tyrosine-protein phosphatase C-like n=1 Tax=Penaeus chinensis TaxID=139456 RepID=UPI001FB77B46|nr:receptor-type tyrosine-protein phosphatase C-like [Penaeus chinensis]